LKNLLLVLSITILAIAGCSESNESSTNSSAAEQTPAPVATTEAKTMTATVKEEVIEKVEAVKQVAVEKIEAVKEQATDKVEDVKEDAKESAAEKLNELKGKY